MLLAGVALGGVGALTSTPWWLLGWAAAAGVVGVLATSLRRAALEGAVLGFAIAYVFMLAVYDGPHPLADELLPFLGFGAVGAAGAAAIAGAVALPVRRRRRS